MILATETGDHISFKNHKLSAKKKTGQKVNESSGDEKPKELSTDKIIGVIRDDIMNPEGEFQRHHHRLNRFFTI